MANDRDQKALNSRNSSSPVASRDEINAYLANLRERRSTTGTGRLIIALDATQSRQPTWDMACSLMAQMFEEVRAIGGLSVQLVYYRGLNECSASKWHDRPEHLSGLMERIDCRMGHTQIERVLAHARARDERSQGPGAGLCR